MDVPTLVCLINEHVRLFFLEKKSTLMIRPCALIIFLIFSHPVRLLSPVRLLGRLEYLHTLYIEIIFLPASLENDSLVVE